MRTSLSLRSVVDVSSAPMKGVVHKNMIGLCSTCHRASGDVRMIREFQLQSASSRTAGVNSYIFYYQPHCCTRRKRGNYMLNHVHHPYGMWCSVVQAAVGDEMNEAIRALGIWRTFSCSGCSFLFHRCSLSLPSIPRHSFPCALAQAIPTRTYIHTKCITISISSSSSSP